MYYSGIRARSSLSKTMYFLLVLKQNRKWGSRCENTMNSQCFAVPFLDCQGLALFFFRCIELSWRVGSVLMWGRIWSDTHATGAAQYK